MDEVESEVAKLKKKWEEECGRALDHICSIEQYWKGGKPSENTSSLQQLNALVQDSLSMLSSLQHKLDALGPQLPSAEKIESAKWKLESWKEECLSLRMKLRKANLQAKEDKKRAIAQERRLLLGGGEESTIRRRNLQTKTGMTSAAENITESLRRTRQLMLQEVERSSSTLITSEESTEVLRKAESEYKGHRSLLVRTRNLLSTMQRQDVIDRLILIAGFAVFCCAVLYVVSKRLGILMLQRKVTAAIKAGMAGGFMQDAPRDAATGMNLKPEPALPFQQAMHDEL